VHIFHHEAVDITKMPDEIPYDELKLREAYREGRRAWAQGEAIPAEFFDEDVEEAFRRGYEDAEEQEAGSGPASSSR
jgi:hypothetical protein